MKKLIKLIFIAFLVFSAQEAFAADRYWVGGGASTNWNATGNTNWAATSGGSNNASVPTTGDKVFIDANCGGGTVTVNVATALLGAFDMTGSVCTLAGSSEIAVTGVTASTQVAKFEGTVTWSGPLRLNPATGSANLNLTTNGTLFTTVTFQGILANTVTLQDNMSFSAAKTNVLTLSATSLDMNGKTISGNSATNRLLVTSNTLGTQRTITRNGGAFANVDFMDIDLEAAYDCSAITGLCGDAGGNSADFTFTTAATQTWSGTSGGNWSTNAWTSRVPLPQDNVVIASAFSSGQTVTGDMPRLGKNIDWTGTTWSGTAPAWATGSLDINIYGSVTLVSGMSVNTSGRTLGLRGRGSHTFTSAGVTWNWPTNMLMYGGTMTLQDALSSTLAFNITSGTFDLNDFNMTSSATTFTNSADVTINAGNGTWTVTTTGTAWNMGASAVFNAEGSTVAVSNTTATAKTFAGGGKTYNIVTFTGQNITVTSSNTFTTLNLSNAGQIGTKFTQSTNTTATNWNINGSVGSLVSASSTSATNATWTKAGGGTVCASYIHITDITASPASTFYAENSTDGGDNTNWTFTACPASGGNDGDWFYF